MKYYIRLIKPFIKPPCMQGCNNNPYPVEGYDWVSEDLEEQLRKEIVVEDSWSDLIFKERFVEVKSDINTLTSNFYMEANSKGTVTISLEEYEKIKNEISRLENEITRLKYEKQELLEYFGYFKKFIDYDIVPGSIISLVEGNMINPYKRCRIEFDFIPKKENYK